MSKMTDAEILSVCDSGIRAAIGQGSDLSTERADAMDRYLGAAYGNEVEGRSQVLTREVLDVVETALPSLIRIFASESNLAEFEPVGPEDEAAARQESEALTHVFWQRCSGYTVLYDAIKDGLLGKNGIAKIWWCEEQKVARERYRGLLPLEREALLSQADVDIEVEEEVLAEDGTHEISILVTRKDGGPRIAVIPPEEFGISGSQDSLDCDRATFLFHRARKTLAELVAAGYSRQKVQGLPEDDRDTEERLARYNWLDEGESSTAEHWSMRQVWVTECYPLLDRDGDGVAERLKVVLAGTAGSYTLLDVEEVDGQPFVSWSPIPRPHAWVGLSLADMAVDIQEQKTALLRGILDNMYLANNARTGVNERVNLQDLLISRPGGVVRTEGMDPPANHLFQFQYPPPPPQVFDLMEYLDRIVKARTGVGDDVAGLDTKALSNVNTGVAALAYDMARMRLELVARNFGEHFVRPLWRKLHELLRKHSVKPMVVRLRNGWESVLPQEWRERENMTISVGIGNASREQRMLALNQVLALQQAALAAGGLGLVTPAQIYASLTDLMELTGIPGAETKYFTDPRQAGPPQSSPDPKLIELQQKGQIEAARVGIEQSRLQHDAAKAQADATLRQAELALKERELGLKAEVERMKAELAMQQRAINEQSEIANARAELATKEIQARQQQINGTLEAMRLQMEAATSARDREERRYEAELKAGIDLIKLQADQQARAVESLAGQVQSLATRPAAEPADLRPLLERIDAIGREVAAGRGPPPSAPVLNLQVGGNKKRLTLVRDAEGRVVGGEAEDLDDDA